jgi:hypothetical protein
VTCCFVTGPTAMGHGLKPQKLRAKVALSLSKLIYLRYFL